MSPIASGNTADLNTDEDIAGLVQIFLDGLPETIKLINQHTAASEWDVVKWQVHTLKGTAGSFGFPHITELCRQIEQALRDDDYDTGVARVGEVTSYIKVVIAQFHHHMG